MFKAQFSTEQDIKFKLKVINFSKNQKSIDSALSFHCEIKILSDTDNKQNSWQY